MPLKLFWKYNDIFHHSVHTSTNSMEKWIFTSKLLQRKALGFYGYSFAVQQQKVFERENKTFDRLAQYSKEKKHSNLSNKDALWAFYCTVLTVA